MRLSNAPFLTRKEFSSQAKSLSHRWLLRGGFMHQHAAGVYTLGPLLTRSHEKLKSLIDTRLEAENACHVAMPIIQPRELWEKSGRWDDYIKSGTMYTTESRQGNEFSLAPTAEEVALDYLKSMVSSSKQLPLTIFQHGTKFRDELRPRSGLLRGREFHMMDAYSFTMCEADANVIYDAMRLALSEIFNKVNLDFAIVSADNGDMGGTGSEEFMAFSDAGEDVIWIDEKGNAANDEVKDQLRFQGKVRSHKSIELGHIFKLGSKYSSAMGFTLDTSGGSQPVIMGCYGIGTSRTLATVVEQNCDDSGIIWPKAISPFDVHIIQLASDAQSSELVEMLQRRLLSAGKTCLIDDRQLGAGGKFADADILGLPYQIIIGKKSSADACEVKNRASGKRQTVSLGSITNYLDQ